MEHLKTTTTIKKMGYIYTTVDDVEEEQNERAPDWWSQKYKTWSTSLGMSIANSTLSLLFAYTYI